MRIPTFASLRAFEATARLKSVRRAAAELCVDHASVTRHIAALQRDLAVPIMKSSPTGIELTDVGEAYAQRIRAAFADLARATADAKLSGVQGSLEIWCMPGFAVRWLTPRIPAFVEAHPELRVTLRPTEGPPDLIAGQADLDIRLSRRTESGLRSAVIANPRWFPVASPAYFQSHPRPKTLSDLLDAALIHEDTYEYWAHWFAAAGVVSPGALIGPRYWQAPMALEAARHGSGIALANEFLVEEELKSGHLVEVLDSSVSIMPYSVFTRAERWDEEPAATFRNWLIRELPEIAPAKTFNEQN
jgi:LysR family glycine cleavage system transcriptional activator